MLLDAVRGPAASSDLRPGPVLLWPSPSHFVSRMTGLCVRRGTLRPSMVIAFRGLLAALGHSGEAHSRGAAPADMLLAPISGLGACLPVSVCAFASSGVGRRGPASGGAGSERLHPCTHLPHAWVVVPRWPLPPYRPCNHNSACTDISILRKPGASPRPCRAVCLCCR